MKAFTVVLPKQSVLPPLLSLLSAPVCTAEPSAPDEPVGHTEGALLDESGRIVAFILRLANTKIAPPGARVLIPRSALRLEGHLFHLAFTEELFHLSFTEDQIRALPRLDDDLQPHNRVDGGPPVESQWDPLESTCRHASLSIL